MRAIQRTDQGGSIATFVIIGVILAAGLIGAAYFLKQHGEQVRKEQAIAAYEQQQTDEESVKSEGTDKPDVVNTVDSEVPDNSAEVTAGSQNLPTTGSDLAISELIGAGLLVVFITSYISSRRNLARSL
jgi:type II secretory pathway pseudopilin PulG